MNKAGASVLEAEPAVSQGLPPDEEDLQMLRRVILERVAFLGDNVTFDFKEMLTRARWVEAAGRLLWSLIRPLGPELLIGPGFGGVPLLYAVALAAHRADGVDLAVWMVRDQRKTYYRKRWVEGPICPPDARAVIVDDFLGRGSAVSLVEEALASDRRTANLCGMGVIFDNWNPLGGRQLRVGRFPVVALFTRRDLGLTRDCHDARAPSMQGSAPPFVQEPSWWRFELNGHTDFLYKASPVVADDAVFVADDQSRVWRFDGASGEAQWCRPSLARPYKGIVQRLQWIDGGLVYGCYDGTVTRLDAATGEVVWRWRVDSSVHATPAVDAGNSRLFINTEQSNGGEPFGHLCALDLASGKTLWRYRHGFWPPATPVYCPRQNLVVAASNDQRLVCVDADTGAVRWQASTRGLVRGAPVLAADAVLVATEDGILQRFDLASGEETRSRKYGQGAVQHVPLSVAGVVVVLDGAGRVVAFDSVDLRIRWMSTLRSPGACMPVSLGEYLAVLSRDGELAVFEPALERKVWEGRIGGDYFQPPAVGVIRGVAVLACASNHAGLKVFPIHSFYQATHP